MRQRIAPQSLVQQHQFSLVMQRILRQTELLMQRRQGTGTGIGATAADETASLAGLEVIESSWDEWAEVAGDQATR